MDRRSLVASLALAAVTSPVLAQTRGPAPGPPAEMGEAETRHMTDTMKTGALALATSRLAVEKAQHDLVKKFAEFEVAEQETIAEVLKSMQGANLATGQGAAPNAEVRDRLDDQGKQILKALQDARGADFDRQYVNGQIEGHQALQKIQEQYIQAGRSREQVNVAKLARGQVKEQISLLRYIDGQLNRS